MKIPQGISLFETTDELSRQVREIRLPPAIQELSKEKLLDSYKEQFLNSLKTNEGFLNSQLVKLKEHFDSHGETIGIGDDLIYMRSINAVFRPPRVYQSHTPAFSWEGRGSEIASEKELITILGSRQFFDLGSWQAFVPAEYAGGETHFYLKDDKIEKYYFSFNKYNDKLWFPIIRFGIINQSASLGSVMRFFLEKEICPSEMESSCFTILKTFGRYFKFSGDAYICNGETALEDFVQDKTTLNGKVLSQLLTDSVPGTMPESSDVTERAIERLCNADKRRANFEPYEKALLEEHTQGHWDLSEPELDEGIPVTLKTPVYARNPYQDLQKGSVIGIDFGTKSTIVSLLDSKGEPIPVPVGGRYNAPKPSDYENPTILHLCDFTSFMEQYRSKPGRPETSWEDFSVSHIAQGELDEAVDKNYYSFITSLKQWAASENEKLELTDDQGARISIPPYLQGGDFDPIEIYAYYVGIAINNMKRNSIYMTYLLSFPVTYKKAVRDKIRESFERGLIKSLPGAIARNEPFLKTHFKVLSGTSEPAAYAVCALKAYRFEPGRDEAHYYGVFDFGGGTTDFDFGVWRGSTEEGEEEDYDYVIEHFGAGGDQFLGGENLLGNLAFTVFSAKENQEILRNHRISFTFPQGEQKKFPGYESLISQNSKWAHHNMHKMKEILRPVWEKTPDYESKFPDNQIQNPTLFDNEGKPVSNLNLSVDLQKLNQEIEDRVRQGAAGFMDKMTASLTKYREDTQVKDIEKIHIFLAGNSCKAEVVRKVFDEACKNQQEDFRRKLLENHNRELETELFELFPPLGTEESFKKMQDRGVSPSQEDFYGPTGKTGVAIGLVLSRPGSRIWVKNANEDESGEIAFKYVLGKERRGCLNPVITGETPLNDGWKRFQQAGSDVLEFYFTSNASGMTGTLAIGKTTRKICSLPEAKPGASVYIRPVSPTEIEYKVADGEDGEPLFAIERISFEEEA